MLKTNENFLKLISLLIWITEVAGPDEVLFLSTCPMSQKTAMYFIFLLLLLLIIIIIIIIIIMHSNVCKSSTVLLFFVMIFLSKINYWLTDHLFVAVTLHISFNYVKHFLCIHVLALIVMFSLGPVSQLHVPLNQNLIFVLNFY